MPPTRKKMRLEEYDYSLPGYYFVTIVTHQRKKLFGEIRHLECFYSNAGEMVLAAFREIPSRYPCVELDSICLMPNHLHALVFIHPEQNFTSLPGVMQWFKIISTKRYFTGVAQNGWPAIDGKLWQRSYYDRIIRSEIELEQTRAYIENNPLNWSTDQEFDPDDHS